MTSLQCHKIFSLLSINTQRRVLVIEQHIGKKLIDIATVLGSTDAHIQELTQEFQRRKGSVGVFMEQLITGVRGDTLCEADDGQIELKGVCYPPAKRPGKYTLSNGQGLKCLGNQG